MRVVDEETRRQVTKNRIDALEADNLFENNFLLGEDLGDDIDEKRDGGDYVVEEAEESEEISQDAEGAATSEAGKVKTKKGEKAKDKSGAKKGH